MDLDDGEMGTDMDADAGAIAAQHRSQPEFDFDDEPAATQAFAREPAPSQPAEAAAAPRQAAAHDAAFADAPVEHDVERTPSGMDASVESAASAYDRIAATTPGAWTDAPIANEPVGAAPVEDDAEAVETPQVPVEDIAMTDASPAPSASPAVQAAEAATIDVERAPEANVATIDVERAPEANVATTEPPDTRPEADTRADNAPRTPGLFDAMPPADPAQTAADAAEDATHASRNA